MKLKKILWLNTEADSIGGCEYYISSVSHQLKKKGFQHILLYSPNNSYSPSFLKLFDASYPAVDLVRQIEEISPNLIFAHQVQAQWLEQICGLSAPVLCFVHDCQVFPQRETALTTFGRKSCYPSKLYKWYYPTLEKLFSLRIFLRSVLYRNGMGSRLFKSYAKMQNFLVGSEYMKKHLNYYGIPEGNISVIPLYADSPTENFERRAASGNLLFVGQLVRGKGLDVLLRALAREPEFSLTVCGSGKQMTELELLAEELQLKDRVDFKGRVSKNQLEDIWQKAEICVIPSRIPETFCMTGPEAMAHGVPVISTSLGGMEEWQGNEAVITVSPNNVEELQQALQKLYNNKIQQNKMAAAGIKIYEEKFNCDKYIDNLIQLFEEKIID